MRTLTYNINSKQLYQALLQKQAKRCFAPEQVFAIIKPHESKPSVYKGFI